MSRKQAICYLIILAIPTVALLVLLAVYHVWLMLLVLLVIVTVIGLLFQFRPQLFAIFQNPKKRETVSLSPVPAPSQRVQYVPNLVLVAHNLPSVRQIVVDKPVFTLGRDARCSYRILNVQDISRMHATIRYDEKTAVSYIVDNGSHNGTFINGVRLAPKKAERIHNGDFIQLGTVRFTAQIAHY